MSNESGLLVEARDALNRIQNFDCETLARTDTLGVAFTFSEVVDPAKRIVELYRRVPLRILADLSDQQLTIVRDNANGDYNRFAQIVEFDPSQGNAADVRRGLIQQVQDAYQHIFNVLHPVISYSAASTTDFDRLDRDARAAVQKVVDDSAQAKGQIDNASSQAKGLLDEMRKMAAEQGVSQQAIHFKEAADGFSERASDWLKYTLWAGAGLAVYAIAMLFSIHWWVFKPDDAFQAAQLVVGKVLVFGVFSSLVYLCARNYLASKHNEIVNRHRQHALATYRALVDAATEGQSQDAVLIHAAACIFSPQPTAFVSDSASSSTASSVIELMSKPFGSMDK